MLPVKAVAMTNDSFLAAQRTACISVQSPGSMAHTTRAGK